MEKTKLLERIAERLADLDSEGLKNLVKEGLERGLTPQVLVRGGLGEGMRLVGERYEGGEYFLSELIMAGVTMNEALDLIRPQLEHDAIEPIGKVVIGTVEGDLHDIGKNIVISMLKSAGFQVHDLGVDVPPAKFAEAVEKERSDLLCLSTLLSVTMLKVQETIEALGAKGLRGATKVLVGGRCLNDEIARTIGADAYGKDAWDAVVKAKGLMGL